MMRIMFSNFIDSDTVANTFVSSEQAAFPVENVANQQRRSKVWRSNGYWNIISGDNTIVFRESIGVDLTATIAPGEYTSTTSFFAAVDSAFEAAGASNYTVIVDPTTLKCKITSDGSGGGGILELRWTDVASLDMAAILGFDSNFNDTGALTYLADELRLSTEEWITWDLGISSNPMAFILTGPRNTPLKITPSAVLKLQGNETDVWTSPSYETTLDYNDSNIIEFNGDGLHTEALRYWRIEILDRSNALGYVEVGVIFLGDFYTPPERGVPQFPFRSQQIDRTDTIFSEGGQTFSEIREKSEGFNFEWFALTKGEKESLENIFFEVGIGVPFFISLDPGSAFSTSENTMVRFVKFDAPPQVSLETPNNFRITWSLREEL